MLALSKSMFVQIMKKENPRGTFIDQKIWSPYNFVPIDFFWFFVAQISLG